MSKSREIILNGKKYISSKRAAKLTGYTNDYVGQLCRGEKIQSRMVGRTRFVNKSSLLDYSKKLKGNEKQVSPEKNIFSDSKESLKKILEKSSDIKNKISSSNYSVFGQKVLVTTLIVVIAFGGYKFSNTPFAQASLQKISSSVNVVSETFANFIDDSSERISGVGKKAAFDSGQIISDTGVKIALGINEVKKVPEGISSVSKNFTLGLFENVSNIGVKVAHGFSDTSGKIILGMSSLSEKIVIGSFKKISSTGKNVSTGFVVVQENGKDKVNGFKKVVGEKAENVFDKTSGGVVENIERVAIAYSRGVNEISNFQFLISKKNVENDEAEEKLTADSLQLTAEKNDAGLRRSQELAKTNSLEGIRDEEQSSSSTDFASQNPSRISEGNSSQRASVLDKTGVARERSGTTSLSRNDDSEAVQSEITKINSVITSVSHLSQNATKNIYSIYRGYSDFVTNTSVTFAKAEVDYINNIRTSGKKISEPVKVVKNILVESPKLVVESFGNISSIYRGGLERVAFLDNKPAVDSQQFVDENTNNEVVSVIGSGNGLSRNIIKNNSVITFTTNLTTSVKNKLANLFDSTRTRSDDITRNLALAINETEELSVNNLEGFAVDFYRTISGLFDRGGGAMFVEEETEEILAEQETSLEPTVTFGDLPQTGQATIIQPIQERIIETTVERIVSGVTLADLQALNHKLRSEIYRVANDSATQTSNNYQAIALTNKIDNLSSVTINNSTITGGTITGATFGGSTLSLTGTVTAGSGTFSGGISATTGSFSGDLSTAGQLTVSGTATSTMAGDFAFDTNTFYIDSVNNRVGIGTTSPSDTLSINGATYLASISAPSDTTDRLYNVSNDLYWAGNLIGGATSANWTLSGSDAYRATGNVGIGTTSPTYKLSVEGISSLGNQARAGYFTATTTTATSTFAGGLTVDTSGLVYDYSTGNVGIGTTSPFAKLAVENTGSDNSFIVGDEANDSSPFVVDASGNVGVGTDSPSRKLEVAEGGILVRRVSGNSAIAVSPDDGKAGLLGAGGIASYLLYDETGYFTIRSTTKSTITNLGTGSSADDKFIVQSDGDVIVNVGNVGIGTSSPLTKLSVQATAGSPALNIASSTGASMLYVDESGNVGVGTGSPAYKLDVYSNTDNGYAGSFVQDHATGWGVLIDVDSTVDNDPALWVKMVQQLGCGLVVLEVLGLETLLLHTILM